MNKIFAKNLNWAILKISGSCNLNCTYCYYLKNDDNNMPLFMDEVTCKTVSLRIAEHCKKYNIKEFHIELHGGEPLFIGMSHFAKLISLLKNNCPEAKLNIFMQTNGLLLNDSWLHFLHTNNIRFGISIDGPPEISDKFRITKNGSGTTSKLLDTINKLRSSSNFFNELSTGALAVIHPEIRGRELVRWFYDNEFKFVDFLLPDGSHNNLPDRWVGAKPYKDFLIDAFNEWYTGVGKTISIRLFKEILRAFLGASSSLDILGGDETGLCVIEPNGSVLPNDVLRICSDTFVDTKMNVFDYPLDQIFSFFDYHEFKKYSEGCKKCNFFSICKGGYLPHRFDGQSFNNRSIYCEALYGLFEHIYFRLRSDVPNIFWKKRS